MCEGAAVEERVRLISSLCTPSGQSPETGCRNKKKHLISPSASGSPRQPNNRWLTESPECHQISMLIDSGLSDAFPEWSGH